MGNFFYFFSRPRSLMEDSQFYKYDISIESLKEKFKYSATYSDFQNRHDQILNNRRRSKLSSVDIYSHDRKIHLVEMELLPTLLENEIRPILKQINVLLDEYVTQKATAKPFKRSSTFGSFKNINYDKALYQSQYQSVDDILYRKQKKMVEDEMTGEVRLRNGFREVANQLDVLLSIPIRENELDDEYKTKMKYIKTYIVDNVLFYQPKQRNQRLQRKIRSVEQRNQYSDFKESKMNTLFHIDFFYLCYLLRSVSDFDIELLTKIQKRNIGKKIVTRFELSNKRLKTSRKFGAEEILRLTDTETNKEYFIGNGGNYIMYMNKIYLFLKNYLDKN